MWFSLIYIALIFFISLSQVIVWQNHGRSAEGSLWGQMHTAVSSDINTVTVTITVTRCITWWKKLFFPDPKLRFIREARDARWPFVPASIESSNSCSCLFVHWSIKFFFPWLEIKNLSIRVAGFRSLGSCQFKKLHPFFKKRLWILASSLWNSRIFWWSVPGSSPNLYSICLKFAFFAFFRP